jgi:AmiR/NasT family two-component response regulator
VTTQRLIQNFRNLRGVLWGGPATAADTLQTTLTRLGMTLARIQESDIGGLDCNRDVMFVDGDCSLDAGLVRRPGTALPPVPAIGLVGVEAPSRLKMLSEIGVTAFLRKPVHAAAVYSSLFLAVNGYHKHRGLELQLAEQDRRRRGRRYVIKAVVNLVQTAGLSDDEAYALLRRDSMRVRMSLEDYCEALTAPAGDTSTMADVNTTVTQETNNEAKPDARGGDGRDGGDAGAVADRGACSRSHQTRRA